MIFKFNEVKRL